MNRRSCLQLCLGLAVPVAAAAGQVIEFESDGRKYQTLTKNGLTIMFAQLPAKVREYSVLQVAVSNGSRAPYVVRPEDFIFRRDDGFTLNAVPARQVIGSLASKASRNDVIKLVTAYETSLYGNSQYRTSTNGYEVRRQNALAEVSSTKIKAAAAASAIAFVMTKLAPGESTDGAVFYSTFGKPMGRGMLTVAAAGTVFEFPVVEFN